MPLHLIYDVKKLEKVEEVNTKYEPDIKHLSLKKFPLQRSRLCGDLTKTAMILCGFVSVDSTMFFSLRESGD